MMMDYFDDDGSQNYLICKSLYKLLTINIFKNIEHNTSWILTGLCVEKIIVLLVKYIIF